jgi:hypothetical protein
MKTLWIKAEVVNQQSIAIDCDGIKAVLQMPERIKREWWKHTFSVMARAIATEASHGRFWKGDAWSVQSHRWVCSLISRRKLTVGGRGRPRKHPAATTWDGRVGEMIGIINAEARGKGNDDWNTWARSKVNQIHARERKRCDAQAAKGAD